MLLSPMELTYQCYLQLRRTIEGVESEVRDEYQDRSPLSNGVTNDEAQRSHLAIIMDEHLQHSLSSTRPSVSPEERNRLARM